MKMEGEKLNCYALVMAIEGSVNEIDSADKWGVFQQHLRAANTGP